MVDGGQGSADLYTVPDPATLTFLRLRVAPFAVTALMIGVAAVVAGQAERWLDAQALSLFFVVPIVVAAIQYGLWASLSAALLSALAVNYLFVEPRHTLAVARGQDAAALLLFALVGVLVSAIAARARAAALTAERHAREALLLQKLASTLAMSGADDQIALAVCASAEEATSGDCRLVFADGRVWGGGLSHEAHEAARWAMSSKQPFALTLSTGQWRFWPVVFHGQCDMALGVMHAGEAASAAVLEQIASQAGVAMARARAAREVELSRQESQNERLKSELLAGVSHDLRTPLASIVFTLQSLQRFAATHAEDTRAELLALAETEARRLAEMVDALLDASRIGREGAPVRLAPVAPRDLVEAALEALGDESDRLQAHIPDELPLISADLILAARALANVIGNALRYSGAGAVEIGAHATDDALTIEVRDRGPGLGADPERLFGKFVRGESGDGRAPGLGLGLALSRQFLEAQGARIHGANRAEGGAVFSIVFDRAGGDGD